MSVIKDGFELNMKEMPGRGGQAEMLRLLLPYNWFE